MKKTTMTPRPIVETMNAYAPGWPDGTPSELCRLFAAGLGGQTFF